MLFAVMPGEEIVREVASGWLPILLDAAVKGMVVLALAGVAVLLMRRASAAARHLVWSLAIVSLPVLPILSAVAPKWQVLPDWMAMPAEVTVPAEVVEQSPSASHAEPIVPQPGFPRVHPGDVSPWPVESAPGDPVARVVEEVTVEQAADPASLLPRRVVGPEIDPAAEPREPSRSRSFQTWGLLAWLGGTVLVLLPLGLGTWSLWRLQCSADRVTDGPLAVRLRQLAAEMGVRRRVVLLRSNRRSMPMHWGIVRPKLLLPAVADEWTQDRQRVVLLHELAHVRRWDCLTQLITQIACALYWFNPLVWVALRRIYLEREAACDDLILQAGHKPSDYAEHLLQIVSGLQSNVFAAYSAIAMARRSRLEGRLRAILDPRRNRRRLTRAAVLVAVAVLVGVMVPMAMMRASDSKEDTRDEQGVKEKAATADASATGARPYDHFLFLRHNEKNGTAETDSLVLATATPEGFEQRDLYTEKNLHVGWKTLGVFGGKVYGLKIHSLLAIDAATGQAENLCSTIDSHAYDSGRLYALAHDRDSNRVLRVFDFRKAAYCDLRPAASGSTVFDSMVRQIAVSPDHRFVAYFLRNQQEDGSLQPLSYRLHVLELETGKVVPTGEPVRYMPPLFSSPGPTAPPLVWADARTILCLRTHVPEKRLPGNAGEVNKLVAIDVTTGKSKDIAPLPGSPHRMAACRIRDAGSTPHVVITTLAQRGASRPIRYRVDLKGKKLVEDATIGGDYRLREDNEHQQLFCEDKSLGREMNRIQAAVSPDGNRVIWFGGRPAKQELFYHDRIEGAVRSVTEGWLASAWSDDEDAFCWCRREDLRAPSAVVAAAGGWIPFADRPKAKPSPVSVDTRKSVTEHLGITLGTDKQAYRLHEPVQVTLTVKNIGDEDLEIFRPAPFDEYVVQLGLDYPGGSRLVSQIQAYLPNREKMLLKAHGSVSATETLEVARTGDYRLKAEFRGMASPDDWRGRLRADPVGFRVVASPDAERLFRVKFERLMAEFRAQFEANPGWDGMNRTLQEDVASMGPDVGPYLVEVLKTVSDPRARKLLYRPLVSVASPDVLPLFEEHLARDAAADREMACRGLYELYCRGQAAEQALQVLLSAVNHGRPEVRRAAAGYLVRIFDPRVKERFARALEDEDEQLRTSAARYLAAAEWLDLAEWLAVAVERPTHARYLAARSVIGDLEATWHTSKGDLPEVAWEQLVNDPERLAQYKRTLLAWRQWAEENPRSSAHFFDADRQHWPKPRANPQPATPVTAVDPKASADKTQETPRDETTRVIFHGLDLTDAPGETDAAKLPDLFEERPPGSKSWEFPRQGVVLVYNQPDGMVMHIPKKNIFYVQHDPLGSSTLHYYGPFEGDPRRVMDLKATPSPTVPDAPQETEATEPPGGDKEALRDIDVRYAEAAAAVAKAEYLAALEANKKVPGTFPQAEVQRLSADWHRAQLDLVEARKAAQAEPASPPPSADEHGASPGREIRSAWGPAVEPGVRFGIFVDKLIWKADEVPQLKADLSHRGTRELRRWGPYELEVDGRWYAESTVEKQRARTYEPQAFRPQTDYRDIQFTLDDRWRGKRSGDPLKLAPGRHRIRLAMDAKPAEDDVEKPIRLLSNVAEIHVLAPGQEVSDQQWLELAAGGAPGSKYTAQRVADMYQVEHGQDLTPAELAKLYATRAIKLAQTAPDPVLLEDTVEQALALDQDPQTEAQLYVYLGDAHWRQTTKYSPAIWGRQRRIAAEAYLTGLKRLLRQDLPAKPPELPAVDRGTVGGPPEVVEAFRRKNAEQMEARRRAQRIRRLVQLRQTLTGQVVQMYAREPDAFDELRRLVVKHLGSEAAAGQIVEGAKARRGDSKTPVPAVEVPLN